MKLEHIKQWLKSSLVKIAKEVQKGDLFDIVAGASIGAFNAAVVVSNAVRSKSWENSAQELVRFWRYQEYPLPTLADFLDMLPLYHMWWDFMHTTNEAAG